MFSLENKVALVIGGTGLLGSALSLALSRNGAKVFAASRNSQIDKDLSKKFSDGGIERISIDASEETSVISATNKIISSHGAINILVNCTSWRPMKKFMDDSIENWNASLKINSASIFLPCKIVGKHMTENGGGSIINISSIYGIGGPPMGIYENCDFETEPDYPFLKAGSIGFSKYLSSYFAKAKVRVNVVAPGGIFNNQPDGFRTKYEERTPMNRMADPEDIAGAVIFLASDASKYITGITLPVDGGWTAV